MSQFGRDIGLNDKKSWKVSRMPSDRQKLKPIAQKFFRSLSVKTPLRKRVDQTFDYIRENHKSDIKERSLFGYLRPVINPIDLPAKNREVIRYIIKSKIEHKKSTLFIYREDKSKYLAHILHYADLNSTGLFYNTNNYLNSLYFRKRDNQIIFSILLDDYPVPQDDWLADIAKYGWGKRTFREFLPFSTTSDLESPLSAKELCETLPEFFNADERKILEKVLPDGVSYKQAIKLLEKNNFSTYNHGYVGGFHQEDHFDQSGTSATEFVFRWGIIIGLALLLGWCVSSISSYSGNSARDGYMNRCAANGTPSSECSENWDEIVDSVNENRN